MSPIFDFFFKQYSDYETYHVVLEIVAVFFGLLSVLFSKQNNIWVYPTGMISTAIFVYLLVLWGLIGDMLINIYYFIIFVFVVYQLFDKWTSWTAYVDTVTTAVFFVGMWLMAKRKVENWLYWVVGDIISVPLYFYKGFTFTSFQYLIFTIIAIFGYSAWKKSLNKNPQTLLK